MLQRAFLLSAFCVFVACSSSEDSGPSGVNDAAVDTGHALPETAPSCSDMTCTKYECRCKNGMSLDASHCTDGVCLDGPGVCGPLCEDKGGVASAKPKPAEADAGADSGPTCIGGGDPCGDCAAANCCSELSSCGGDAACLNATICLAMCKDGFAACVEKCAPEADTKFRPYMQCLENKGCASKCSGTL